MPDLKLDIKSFDDLVADLIEKLFGWLETGVNMLPNLFVALLVLFITRYVARWVRKGVLASSKRFTDNRQVGYLISRTAYVAVLVGGLFVALGVMNLDKTVTSMLAGVGIVGLALGFAFRELATNFISGVFMAVRRPFKIGDLIETNDFTGVIEEVDFRATHLRLPSGERVQIPNSKVINDPIVNLSHSGRRRVDLSCGVAYGDDLEQAKELAIEAVKDVEGRLEDEEIEMYFTEFGDSSINFVVRFWIPFSRFGDMYAAQSDAIIRLEKAFDEHGITIPFPIRTLDFGVVGGRSLASEVEGVQWTSSGGQGGDAPGDQAAR